VYFAESHPAKLRGLMDENQESNEDRYSVVNMGFQVAHMMTHIFKIGEPGSIV
jgi:hypothetical protein